MRTRVIVVHDDILRDLFGSRQMSSIDSDWPKDARILDGLFDMDRRVMRLLVESASFDDVPVNHHSPEWSPTFTVTTPAPVLVRMIEKFRADEGGLTPVVKSPRASCLGSLSGADSGVAVRERL